MAAYVCGSLSAKGNSAATEFACTNGLRIQQQHPHPQASVVSGFCSASEMTGCSSPKIKRHGLQSRRQDCQIRHSVVAGDRPQQKTGRLEIVQVRVSEPTRFHSLMLSRKVLSSRTSYRRPALSGRIALGHVKLLARSVRSSENNQHPRPASLCQTR